MREAAIMLVLIVPIVVVCRKLSAVIANLILHGRVHKCRTFPCLVLSYEN